MPPDHANSERRSTRLRRFVTIPALYLGSAVVVSIGLPAGINWWGYVMYTRREPGPVTIAGSGATDATGAAVHLTRTHDGLLDHPVLGECTAALQHLGLADVRVDELVEELHDGLVHEDLLLEPQEVLRVLELRL